MNACGYMTKVTGINHSRCNLTLHTAQTVLHAHNDLGMYAGLLQAPEVLCVHVDRFIYEGHGRVRKTDTPVFFGGPIDVPVFTDDGLDCTWERYQMTAAFAHQGDAATGHYQALLRTQPSIRHPDADTYWLHCDDDRPPRPCRMLPHQFQEGVTCIWLCRQDIIDLHAWEEDLLTTPPGHAQNQDQLLKLHDHIGICFTCT